MDPALQRAVAALVDLPPVDGALVLTTRGRVLAACVPAGTDLKSLAREVRSLLTSSAATRDRDDPPVRVDVRSGSGSTVLLPAGPGAVLAVLTSTRTPESLSLELSRAADAIGRILG